MDNINTPEEYQDFLDQWEQELSEEGPDIAEDVAGHMTPNEKAALTKMSTDERNYICHGDKFPC